MYWRIIRTNEDGSVRLLYSGTSPDTTEGYIGTSAFNNSTKDPLYVGYMYGTSGSLESNRTNENDSTIKTVIDKWYQNNLLNDYDKYISKSAIYCNDRNASNYALEGTYYSSAYNRIEQGSPTLKCENKSDSFSYNNTSAKLKYPIALVTTDELNFAGGYLLRAEGIYFTVNSNNLSITNTLFWWTMSPWGLYTTIADTFRVKDTGVINGNNVSFLFAVRPVISVSSCARVKSGNGTADNPYVVDEEASTC